jgi:hypothetical protein
MKHTLHKRWRWQRAHTLAIVVIDAVFQAPMFALNAVANENACGPSRALKEPFAASAPTVRRSVQCIVHERPVGLKSACGAMRGRSTIEMRRNCGGWMWANSERAVLSLVHKYYSRNE